jgi:pilus assembly protein CpaB
MFIALLLAGLAAVLVYATIARQDSGGSGGSAAADQVQVVVARDAIPERTRITEDMLELKTIAAGGLVDGAFTSLPDTVGKVTRLPIARNAQVVQSSVVSIDGVSDTLETIVPTDKRAMSISASQVLSAGGLILPGDFVDLIWICCGGTGSVAQTLLPNVQVAAVAQTIVSAGPPGASGEVVAAGDAAPDPEAVTLTLIVTPEEGQRIFLAEQNGTFRATLRGPDDKNLPATPRTTLPDLLPADVVNSLPEQLRPY